MLRTKIESESDIKESMIEKIFVNTTTMTQTIPFQQPTQSCINSN